MERLGAAFWMAVTSTICPRASASDVSAVTASGVVCSFSDVRRALTTISCTVSLEAAPVAASARTIAGGHASAIKAAQPSRLVRIFIHPPLCDRHRRL